MSNLEVRPDEYVCGALGEDGPEELLIEARQVWLGRTGQVARVLPDRRLRMIGAWCFLDHYGPEDVARSPGMQVWPHPHTGLQTVSWLLEGAVEHRDGLGSRVTVRPGQLHLMTAGSGIVHSEMSAPNRPRTLHGVQLWVALPDSARTTAPQFRSYLDLPELVRPGLRARVMVGEVDGTASPASTYTPLSAADLTLEAGTSTRLPLQPDQEYGVFVLQGGLQVESTPLGVDQLVYLGRGRTGIDLQSSHGGRALLLGGEPFTEELVMWWNFVGRSHAEIVAYRDAWVQRDARFAPVSDPAEKVMEAPPLPTVVLRPRSRRPDRPDPAQLSPSGPSRSGPSPSGPSPSGPSPSGPSPSGSMPGPGLP